MTLRRRSPAAGPLPRALAAGLALSWVSPMTFGTESVPGAGWSSHAGDGGSTRYSALDQITPENVRELQVAWRYSTGELTRRGPELIQNSSTQVTPILAGDKLVFCTPFNRIIALDPATGTELWVHDPDIDLSHRLPFQYNCRGVALWEAPDIAPGQPCRHRVLSGTNDMRIIAVDLEDGRRCQDFGDNGEIAVPHGPTAFAGEIKITSPPAVVNGVVVVGTFIMDNLRRQAPDGTVHAFDARTGAPRWQFDPIPRDPADPAWETWHDDSAPHSGAGNVWAPMSVDAERDLIFLPVSSAAPDFWGGDRPGDNLYTGSVVALRAGSGEYVWHFQHVRHDIWDYDTPAAPLLFDLPSAEGITPALALMTKQGFVFVLDRETGKPLFETEDRPVPQSAMPGEWLSPTQPFPVRPAPLLPERVRPEDAWGFTFWDRRACRRLIASLHHEGMFTPPTTAPGTLLNPGTAGGMNWGGAAWSLDQDLLIVNLTNVPQVVELIPRQKIPGVEGISLVDGKDVAAMQGSPYGISRRWLLSPLGAPCVAPPWGELVAIDTRDGEIRWRSPLGSIRDHLPVPLNIRLGTPNLGGPLVTAGGLVFIGATMDRMLRAFDLLTGSELWSMRMPAGTQTSPMTYEADGRQYVVLATGHHLWFGSKAGDELIALALPEDRRSSR